MSISIKPLEDRIALGDVDGHAVAGVIDATRAHGHDLALLGLLLGGVLRPSRPPHPAWSSPTPPRRSPRRARSWPWARVALTTPATACPSTSPRARPGRRQGCEPQKVPAPRPRTGRALRCA